MSACRFLSNYVLSFFNAASDNKPEESVATTQAKPVVNKDKSMADFVRGFVGEVIQKKRQAPLAEEELRKLHAQSRKETDPWEREEIERKIKLALAERKRFSLGDSDWRKLGLLLSIETDPNIRKEIHEDMLMSDKNIRDWRKVAQMIKTAFYFLTEEELKKIKESQGSLKESLDQTFRFNQRLDVFEVERQYAMLNLIDDKDKRKKIIATIIDIFESNFFWIAPLHLLRIAIDKVTHEEVRLFLPLLSTALNAKKVPFRLEPLQIEDLHAQALCLVMQIKQLNLVTTEDLEKHNIVLNTEQADHALAGWEEILRKEVQSNAQTKLSVLQITSLEKAVCQNGNDKVLSLLIDCILKNTVCDKNKRLVSQFTMFSSLSFALSQVFKKGYSFASEETKEKMQAFLLDQFFCPYQMTGSFLLSTNGAIYNEIIDLMQFVMSKMPDESKRVQYLEKVMEKRRMIVKTGEKSDQWQWDASDKLIAMLATHGVLHQYKLKAQALGSVLENDDISFPKEISAIAKRYALSL